MGSTYGGDPSASDVAAVRFEIQDTDTSAFLLTDEEIAFAILNDTGVTPDPTGVSLEPPQLFASAARCCEALARNFAMQADTEVGSLKEDRSKQMVTYAQRAQELRAKASGFYAPYSGGESISEKESWRQDTDATKPKFTRDEFSNPWIGADRNSPDDFGPPVSD